MAKDQANKKDNKEKKDNKNFFKEFKAELKRVSWPTPKQLVNNTTVVIGIVVLVAVIVFILDVIFENLNNFGVERLKALVTSSSSETAEESGDGTVLDGSQEIDLTNVVSAEETNTEGDSAEETNSEENSAEETETEDEATEENKVEENSVEESN